MQEDKENKKYNARNKDRFVILYIFHYRNSNCEYQYVNIMQEEKINDKCNARSSLKQYQKLWDEWYLKIYLKKKHFA